MKKINFQDLPSTDTPIKASTLNTMQSNIEESCVAVSPTQPETNERIWIQKGKNLFNINNYNLFNGWFNVDTKNFESNNNGYLVYIPCEPNTTYVASRKFLERNFRFGSGNIVPVNGGIATQVIEAKDLTEVSLTTGTNDRYLYVYIHYEGDSSYSFEEIISSLCIEEASSATPKKIWCKNDNGVFEEFVNVNKINNAAQLDTTPQTPNGNTKISHMQLHYNNGYVLHIKAITDGVEHSFEANLTQLD